MWKGPVLIEIPHGVMESFIFQKYPGRFKHMLKVSLVDKTLC